MSESKQLVSHQPRRATFYWKGLHWKGWVGQPNSSGHIGFSYLRVFGEKISFARNLFFRCLVRRRPIQLRIDLH